jgi:hypothetical protein
VAALTEDGVSNEFLAKPLFDGGQGKNNNNTTLPLPRGDISHGTISHGTECPTIPLERDTPARPAERSTQTRQSCGSATEQTNPQIPTRAVKTKTGQIQLLEGLKPPTLDATGSLVSGKDIKNCAYRTNGRDTHCRNNSRTSQCGQPTRAQQCSRPQHPSQISGAVTCAPLALQRHTQLRGAAQ